MKRRRIILICSGIVVIFAVLTVAFLPGEQEPEDQVRKLSEWVDGLRGDISLQDQDEAREAIRAIVINNLPRLLAWLDYKLSKGKRWVKDFAEKLPAAISDRR